MILENTTLRNIPSVRIQYLVDMPDTSINKKFRKWYDCRERLFSTPYCLWHEKFTTIYFDLSYTHEVWVGQLVNLSSKHNEHKFYRLSLLMDNQNLFWMVLIKEHKKIKQWTFKNIILTTFNQKKIIQ